MSAASDGGGGEAARWSQHVHFMQQSFSAMHYQLYTLQQRVTASASTGASVEPPPPASARAESAPQLSQVVADDDDSKEIMAALFAQHRSPSSIAGDSAPMPLSEENAATASQAEFERLRDELARVRRELEEERLLARRRAELKELLERHEEADQVTLSAKDDRRFKQQVQGRKLAALASDGRDKGIETLKKMVGEPPDAVLRRRSMLAPLPQPIAKRSARSAPQSPDPGGVDADEALRSVRFRKRQLPPVAERGPAGRAATSMDERLSSTPSHPPVLASVSRFAKRSAQVKKEPQRTTSLPSLPLKRSKAHRGPLPMPAPPTTAPRPFDIEKSVAAIVRDVTCVQAFFRFQLALRFADALKPYVRIVDKGLPTLQNHLHLMLASRRVKQSAGAVVAQRFIRWRESANLAQRARDERHFKRFLLVKNFVAARASFLLVRSLRFRRPLRVSLTTAAICAIFCCATRLRAAWRKLRGAGALPPRNADGTDPAHRCSPFIQLMNKLTCSRANRRVLATHLCDACQQLHNPRKARELRELGVDARKVSLVMMLQARFRFLLARRRASPTASCFAGIISCPRCLLLADEVRKKIVAAAAEGRAALAATRPNTAERARLLDALAAADMTSHLPSHAMRTRWDLVMVSDKSRRPVRRSAKDPAFDRNQMCASCYANLRTYAVAVGAALTSFSTLQTRLDEGTAPSKASSGSSLSAMDVGRFVYDRLCWLRWRRVHGVRYDPQILDLQSCASSSAARLPAGCDRCRLIVGAALFPSLQRRNAAAGSAVWLPSTSTVLGAPNTVCPPTTNVSFRLAADDESNGFPSRLASLLALLHCSTACTDAVVHEVLRQRRVLRHVRFVLHRIRWVLQRRRVKHRDALEQQGIYLTLPPLKPSVRRGAAAYDEPCRDSAAGDDLRSAPGASATLTSALQQQRAEEDLAQRAFRHRLVSFYTDHCPERLAQVDFLCRQYRGREDALFTQLHAKYAESIAQRAGVEEEQRQRNDVLRKRLHLFYSLHNPEKLSQVDNLVALYGGQEDELFRKLCLRYAIESSQWAAELERHEGASTVEPSPSMSSPPQQATHSANAPDRVDGDALESCNEQCALLTSKLRDTAADAHDRIASDDRRARLTFARSSLVPITDGMCYDCARAARSVLESFLRPSQLRAETSTNAVPALVAPLPPSHVATGDEVEALKSLLVPFYRKHQPDKPLADIATIARHFAAPPERREELMKRLESKYGCDPRIAVTRGIPDNELFPRAPVAADGESDRTARINDDTSGAAAVLRRHAFRARLVRFYARFQPGRVAVVDEVIGAYEGREGELVSRLYLKYGAHPNDALFDDDAAEAGQAVAQPSELLAADVESLRRRLERFYAAVQPPNVPRVDALLRAFAGAEGELLQKLRDRYQRDPRGAEFSDTADGVHVSLL